MKFVYRNCRYIPCCCCNRDEHVDSRFFVMVSLTLPLFLSVRRFPYCVSLWANYSLSVLATIFFFCHNCEKFPTVVALATLIQVRRTCHNCDKKRNIVANMTNWRIRRKRDTVGKSSHTRHYRKSKWKHCDKSTIEMFIAIGMTTWYIVTKSLYKFRGFYSKFVAGFLLCVEIATTTFMVYIENSS